MYDHTIHILRFIFTIAAVGLLAVIAVVVAYLLVQCVGQTKAARRYPHVRK